MHRNLKVAICRYIAPFILLIASNAFGFPCTGEPITTGDTQEEVAARCGEPMLKDKRVISVKETEGKTTRSSVTKIEEWTYNGGTTVLMQSFRFENGKVAEIGSPGYGPVQDFSVDNCRNGELLAVGDSILEAFMKCGDPIAKEDRADKVIETKEGGIKRQTKLSVVDWTYRYGPNALGYTLRFENGRVANIRPREFGK